MPPRGAETLDHHFRHVQRRRRQLQATLPSPPPPPPPHAEAARTASVPTTQTAAQLDSPTKHCDARAKFFPRSRRCAGTRAWTRVGHTPSTSPVATVSVSPSTESSGPLPNVNVGEAACAHAMVVTSRTPPRYHPRGRHTHRCRNAHPTVFRALLPRRRHRRWRPLRWFRTDMTPSRLAQLASRSADVRRVVNPTLTPSNTLTVPAPSSASSVSGVRHVVNAARCSRTSTSHPWTYANSRSHRAHAQLCSARRHRRRHESRVRVDDVRPV